jgi:alkylhydroperoxidase/carboxymuconolactone decarboxylase family protein YurZ
MMRPPLYGAHASRSRDLRAGSRAYAAVIAKTIMHLVFYAEWPNIVSAMPVAKDVLEKRPC